MKKFIAIFILLLTFLAMGGVVWIKLGGDPEEVEGSNPPPEPEATVAKAQYGSLKRRYDDTAARLREVEGENRRLKSEVERLKRSPTTAQPTKPSDGSGIRWSEFSRSITENLEMLSLIPEEIRQNGTLTPDQRTKMMGIMGELLKITSKAKTIAAYPLFDEVIFAEFTQALLEQPLKLNEDQVRGLTEINEAIFETVVGDTDPSELLPLERQTLKKEIASQLWESLEGILDATQLEDWRKLEEFSQAIVEGTTNTKEYGLASEDLDAKLIEDWKRSYSLDESQLQSVGPLATGYLSDAKLVLERYGQTDEDIKNLPIEERKKMEREFFDLQEQVENQVLPLLSEEQKDALYEGDLTIIRFDYGSGVRASVIRGLF